MRCHLLGNVSSCHSKVFEEYLSNVFLAFDNKAIQTEEGLFTF